MSNQIYDFRKKYFERSMFLRWRDFTIRKRKERLEELQRRRKEEEEERLRKEEEEKEQYEYSQQFDFDSVSRRGTMIEGFNIQDC